MDESLLKRSGWLNKSSGVVEGSCRIDLTPMKMQGTIVSESMTGAGGVIPSAVAVAALLVLVVPLESDVFEVASPVDDAA